MYALVTISLPVSLGRSVGRIKRYRKRRAANEIRACRNRKAVLPLPLLLERIICVIGKLSVRIDHIRRGNRKHRFRRLPIIDRNAAALLQPHRQPLSHSVDKRIFVLILPCADNNVFLQPVIRHLVLYVRVRMGILIARRPDLLLGKLASLDLSLFFLLPT